MNEQQVRDLERAIATDERTHELGIRLRIRGDHLVVSGEVASDARRATVLEVIEEHHPGLEVVDQITLSAEPGPGRPDHEQINPPRRS